MKTQEQALYSLLDKPKKQNCYCLKRKLRHPLQLCRPLLVACAKFSCAAAAAATTHCHINLSTNWRNLNAMCILSAPAQIHHTSSLWASSSSSFHSEHGLHHSTWTHSVATATAALSTLWCWYSWNVLHLEFFWGVLSRRETFLNYERGVRLWGCHDSNPGGTVPMKHSPTSQK
jgi:hypothetical protein